MYDDVQDDPKPGLVLAVNERPVSIEEVDLRPGVDPECVGVLRTALAHDWRKRQVDWSDFACIRGRRKPCVVILYTGGTIGARDEAGHGKPRRLKAVHSKFDVLLGEYRKRVWRDLRHSVPEIAECPGFHLHWECLEPSKQLLSENATTESWNNLLEGVERCLEKYVYLPEKLQSAAKSQRVSIVKEQHDSERKQWELAAADSKGDSPRFPSIEEYASELTETYCMGVIVLHGTDTMGYSSAALALALRGLPCSIVMTGANLPPEEDKILKSSPLSFQSDAWANILSSIRYLCGIGMYLTEVVVCFGHKVLSPFNLRKTLMTQTVSGKSVRSRLHELVFGYRAEGRGNALMFQEVGGGWVESCYPLGGTHEWQAVASYAGEELRHTRFGFLKSHRVLGKAMRFQAGVVLVRVAPAMIEVTTVGDVRALLVEGYDSATFSTKEGTAFRSLLVKAINKGIPILVATPHGALADDDGYETELFDGEALDYVSLYGVTIETALPLVCQLAAEIDRDRWNARGGGMAKIRARCALIREALDEWDKEPSTLLWRQVQGAGRSRGREKDIDRELQETSDDRDRAADALFDQSKEAGKSLARDLLRANPQGFGDRVVMLRHHFL